MFNYIFLLIFLSESYESDPTDGIYETPKGITTSFYCESDKACFRNLKFHLRKNCAKHCDSETTEIFTMEKRKTQLQNLFRSKVPLPCSCQSSYKLLDLGQSYFPRYVPTVECQPITCWNPPYSCQEKSYKVKVLRKRKADPSGELESVDFNIPENMRNHYISESLTVTVACECTS